METLDQFLEVLKERIENFYALDLSYLSKFESSWSNPLTLIPKQFPSIGKLIMGVNAEFLREEKNFQPLDGLKNLEHLFLCFDPSQTFETCLIQLQNSPLLKYLQTPGFEIGLASDHVTKNLLENLSTRINVFKERVKRFQGLIPGYHPFNMKLPNAISAHLTDEDILDLRPAKPAKWTLDFSNFSKLTSAGLMKFLENVPELHYLDLMGCDQIEKETIEALINKYQGVTILSKNK